MAIDRNTHPFFAGSWPVVIGHRGTAGTRPENTMVSFAQALEDGADIIECDLHLTKDGEIVLIHDPTLERTTDGTGPVGSYTLAELKEFDAGYRFTPDGGKTFPFRGQGHTIPTLREALEAFPDTRFCLELKDKGNELVEKAIDMIVSHQRPDKTLLATFNFASQRHIYRYLDRIGVEIPVTASQPEAIAAVIGAKTGFLPPPGKVDIFALPPERKGIKLLTPAFNDYIHRHGRLVSAWTIDDPGEIRMFLDQGVDAIVTNYPARAVSVRAGWRGGPGL